MIEFTVKLERDESKAATIVTVEALLFDVDVRLSDDRRTLLGLLQGSITSAIERWNDEKKENK